MVENQLKNYFDNDLIKDKSKEKFVSLLDYYTKETTTSFELVEDVLCFFDIEKTSKEAQVMMIIAEKLDAGYFHDTGVLYHNLQHFKEVFISSVFLAKINNQLKEKNALKLNKLDISLLLLSAISHDLSHDGKGNQGVLFKCEEHSFNQALKEMNKIKMSKENVEIVEAIILSTDINGPQNYAKALYQNKFLNKDISVSSSQEIKEKLEILKENKKALYMSMILGDADLLPSAGLTYDKTVRQTRRLFAEVNKITEDDLQDVKTIIKLDFFIDFCKSMFKDGFTSFAGKKCNENHKHILSKFEEERKEETV